LTGEARYHLYLLAAGTGFRANALANLSPADFDLESDSPTVTLSARYNKSGKTKVQPIPYDVVDALRGYLSGKPANARIWAGTWSSGCTGAEMLRRDLEACGIAYAVDGPDGPEYADFHALRHTYLTLLGRHGVDLRTAQELAGHSTPELTARYTHRRLHDLTGAVNKLPTLVPALPMPVEIPLRMTGTDGGFGTPKGAVPGAVPGAVRGGIRPHSVAPMFTLGVFGGGKDDSWQPLEIVGAGAEKHRPAPTCTTGAFGIRTQNQGIMSPLL
jgi:Phage integrase family